jgi:hypothetical protein
MQGRVFQYLLLGATLLPFATPLLPQSSVILALVFVIGLIGGTHVPATAYLFFSRDICAGVPNWKWTIVVAPLILIALVFIFCLAMPTQALMAFMLIYIHFGIWHFGRQNLGVVSFSVRIGRARPMNPFERHTINAGVLAGMCAAYTAFGPSLLLHPTLFPLPVSAAAPYLEKLWYVGAAVYAVLIPIVFYHIWNSRENYDLPSAFLYLSGVLFFLSLFLTTNPVLAVGAWSMAHGLQYQLFLIFHAKSRMRTTVAGLLPGVVLILAATAGYLLWTTYPSWSPLWLARTGGAAVVGINLAHYWVDMFLWRFQTPERRAWLREHYSFLGGVPAIPAPRQAAPHLAA